MRVGPCYESSELEMSLFLDRIEEPMTLKVILEEGEDSYIIAECPQIPGCMSQGKTKEEALANITDAVQACLRVMAEKRRCSA